MMEKKLPEGWAAAKLGELYYFPGGGTPSKANSSYWNGDISWASIKDISRVEVLESTQDYITESGLRNSASNLAQIGEVIIGTRMSPGKPVLTKIVTAINQDLKIVRSHLPIPSSFTYYLFRYLENEFESRSAGTTVKGIRLDAINDISIALPPIAEQKRIVAKLDMAFGYLDKIEFRWKTILDLRDKFVECSLIQKDSKKFYKTEKLSEFLEESTKRIGRDWQEKLKVGVSAQKGIIHLETGQKTSFDNYKIVLPGDFVYNAMRVNIGSIAQYEGNEIAITSPDYIVFRVKRYLSPKLLLSFLKSPNGLIEIGANTKGSVRSRLYYKSLGNINYPIAPLSIQTQAEEILTWYSKAVERWENIVGDSISKLRHALLTKAFRGELVQQNQADEPATVLLEK
jgi:type I restriction enzyme, S subunit